MLFSEIYSAYYNTVASIINCAQKEKLDSDSLYEIVKKSAFPESVITIGSALESEKWLLIKKDYTTNIKNTPTMPLSLLQKRWLKAICCDKRMRLFADDEVLEHLDKDLTDVEPLFTENDFYLYDRYSDGDPYDDSAYIENFHTILKSLHQNKKIYIEYTSRKGQTNRFCLQPFKIEYSQKDDKFRIISKIRNHQATLNIARIVHCEIKDDFRVAASAETDLPCSRRCSVSIEIYDARKALERVMLAFAHFEKSAVQISNGVYRLSLNYDSRDETELVIRVLSFGPMIKVLEPQSFVDLVKDRISRQMELIGEN